MLTREQLREGDCLLYGRVPLARSRAGWFFGGVTMLKTVSPFCHVEIYDGDGESLAARDGVGVGCYPLRMDQLVCVRRPPSGYEHDRVRRWFDATADGQGYDWLGLLNFALAAKQSSPDKMFCSEFAVRAYRVGLVRPVNPDMDADRCAPAHLWQTPALATVWQAAGLPWL